MQSTIELHDATDPTICVRIHPASISDLGLVELRYISTPQGKPGDCLRAWIRKVVNLEMARRTSADGDLQEPEAWTIAWHEWSDSQLSGALCASYAWYDVCTESTAATALREIHRAVLTVAASRLNEFGEAIELALRNK